ncbi:GNAT family N-acetyltransferase [Brochothrix thermosphacta]|uniref:GNAT family N-acetyltransferase n=1 Tax=Brochothrix thermosphacta TaxID=2756 RepID=UPI00241FDE45|nr:GNAT family N-acetyltransferase [Brochothrix thermosphacta]
MKNLTIRKIQKEDYPQLVAIENSVWTVENTPGIVHYNNTSEYMSRYPIGSNFVAVDENNHVVGVLQYENATPLPTSNKTLSLSIAVSQTAQNAGAGSALMNRVKDYAREHNYRKLTLRALGSNARALAFYQKHQFVIEGHLKDEFYIDGKFVDDYLLSYFL